MGKGGGGLSMVSPVIGAISGNNGGGKGMDLFGGISNMRNGVFGINDQAKYAQRAAMAEQAQRAAVTQEARNAANRMNLKAQSPQQLAALESGLKAAQTQVDTDLRQLAAIDPAIMEASKQVLTLLQGGQAAVNGPAMQQRQQQRQQLVDSLRAQYGPSAESSSVGQHALQQFDMQSSNMFQQNQMNSLNNVFGIASKRIQGPGFGELMDVQQGFGNYQGRQLQAEQAGSQDVLNAMQGQVQSAGAQYTGDILKAGARRQFYQQMEDDGRQIGRSWATMGMGGKSQGSNGGGSTGGYSSSMNQARGGQRYISGAAD